MRTGISGFEPLAGAALIQAQRRFEISDISLFQLTGSGPAVKTPVQLGARINILRYHRGNIRALVENQLQRPHETPDSAVKDTLDFLRNWAQFKIPTALTTLGSLASDVLGPAGTSISDASVFAGELE